MKQLSVVILLAGLILMNVLSGCNLFSFAKPDSADDDLIEDGRELLRQGRYDEAWDQFNEAVIASPNDSRARYLRAKAALLRSGENVLNITTELSTFQTSGARADLPFQDRTTWHNARANGLFQAVAGAIEDLTTIKTGAATGNIEVKDVQLDLVVALSIQGILRFRDTNSDGVIDNQDIDISIFFDQDRLQQDGLVDLYNQIGADGINDMLDNIDQILADAGNDISELLGEDMGINTENLDEVMDDIKSGASVYRVEAGVDNDGDGQIDEEIFDGIDNDGDGLVDEDCRP